MQSVVPVLMDILIAVLVGVGLWLALPRGVVLVRERDLSRHDTWVLTNDSPLPILLTHVLVRRIQNPVEWVPLDPTREGGHDGVRLMLSDEIDEITRFEQRRGWEGLEVRPGDALVAHVGNNAQLNIRYRRSGLFGVLERRCLQVNGGV